MAWATSAAVLLVGEEIKNDQSVLRDAILWFVGSRKKKVILTFDTQLSMFLIGKIRKQSRRRQCL